MISFRNFYKLMKKLIDLFDEFDMIEKNCNSTYSAYKNMSRLAIS